MQLCFLFVRTTFVPSVVMDLLTQELNKVLPYATLNVSLQYTVYIKKMGNIIKLINLENNLKRW